MSVDNVVRLVPVAQLAEWWSLGEDDVAWIMGTPGPYTVAQILDAEKKWDAEVARNGGDPSELAHFPYE